LLLVRLRLEQALRRTAKQTKRPAFAIVLVVALRTSRIVEMDVRELKTPNDLESAAPNSPAQFTFLTL
jgi:hypothetical protein